MKYKSFTIRDDGTIKKMLDDINSHLPFKASYSELIRSLVKSCWLKFNDGYWDENVDNVQYEVKEMKFK